MSNVIDIKTGLPVDLPAEHAAQAHRLMTAVGEARMRQVALDLAIEERNALIVASVDLGLDIRHVIAPATGLTHTRINQILAKEEA